MYAYAELRILSCIDVHACTSIFTSYEVVATPYICLHRSLGLTLTNTTPTKSDIRRCLRIDFIVLFCTNWGMLFQLHSSLVPSRKKSEEKICLVTLRTILDTRSNFHTFRQEFECANRNTTFL